jgi:hypothetical protein
MKIKILCYFQVFLAWIFCFSINNLKADPLNASINTPSSDQIVAKDSSISFSGSATGGCPPYTYSWNFGSADPSSSSSSSASATLGDACSGQVTTVTFTVTDASGATDTDNVDVTVPDIQSTTESSAPDGTDNSRDTIGVGEKVDMAITPAGLNPTWSTSQNGTIQTPGDPDNATLTAGDTSGQITVTAYIQGFTLTNSFNVVVPSSLTATKAYGYSTIGSTWQIIQVKVHPENVSFDNVYWSEDTCPASKVSGYFWDLHIKTINNLDHDPQNNGTYQPSYIPFNQNIVSDMDKAVGLPPTYEDGYMEWKIPTSWITTDDYNTGNSRTPFDQSPVTQSFSMASTGIITISKLNVSTP